MTPAAENSGQPCDRIAIDPAICLGKPRVRGTRITVEFVLKLLRSGCTADEVVRDYPELSPADIRRCVSYGDKGNN